LALKSAHPTPDDGTATSPLALPSRPFMALGDTTVFIRCNSSFIYLSKSPESTTMPRFSARLFLLASVLSLILPLLTIALTQDYAHARNVRLNKGHEAAVPLYQELLQEYPTDITAATRIAACRDTPCRHDAACPVEHQKIQRLRTLLNDSNYDNRHIQGVFGISENHKLAFAAGPVYLTPASAGTVTEPIRVLPEANDCSLQCLVSLFLLGLSGMILL